MKHILVFLLLASYSATAQKSALVHKPAPTVAAPASALKYELKGVVTYFFNDNYGNKPDTGAKAFIIKETALQTAGIKTGPLVRYLVNHDVMEYDPAQALPQPLPGEEGLKKEIEDMEPAAMSAQQAIITSTATSTLTADGAGVFTKKLAPGSYLVMIRSANRTRMNLIESLGQVTIKHVVVKGDDIEVAANFRP